MQFVSQLLTVKTAFKSFVHRCFTQNIKLCPNFFCPKEGLPDSFGRAEVGVDGEITAEFHRTDFEDGDVTGQHEGQRTDGVRMACGLRSGKNVKSDVFLISIVPVVRFCQSLIKVLKWSSCERLTRRYSGVSSSHVRRRFFLWGARSAARSALSCLTSV